MAKYLAYQIILHKLMYNNIIAKFQSTKKVLTRYLMVWVG